MEEEPKLVPYTRTNSDKLHSANIYDLLLALNNGKEGWCVLDTLCINTKIGLTPPTGDPLRCKLYQYECTKCIQDWLNQK